MATVDIQLFRLGTRSILWFVVVFGLLFLVRVPFLLFHYVPYHLPFEPWVALIPLVGMLWGVPAVLAVGAATALGDWLGGLRGALPVFHAAGMMAWAWSARSLWTGPKTDANGTAARREARPSSLLRGLAAWPRGDVGEDVAPVTWSASLHFLAISVPGALVAAAITALGADIVRSYPFSYVAFISACNHLAYLLVFGMVLYRVFERELVPRFGSWDEYAGKSQRPSSLGMLLQVVGAAGAWGLGYLVAVWLGYPGRGPAVMGDTAGMRLLPGVLPFLVLFFIGLFLPRTGKR